MDRRKFLVGAGLGIIAASAPISISAFGAPTKKTTKSGRLKLSFTPFELKLRHAFNLAKSSRTSTPGVQVKLEYEGVVGYGGNGDPINPKTGKHASEYMVQVHEDLNQPHPNGGQAKFLEEAVQQYAQQEFPRTVAQYIRDALSSILGGD